MMLAPARINLDHVVSVIGCDDGRNYVHTTNGEKFYVKKETWNKVEGLMTGMVMDQLKDNPDIS